VSCGGRNSNFGRAVEALAEFARGRRFIFHGAIKTNALIVRAIGSQFFEPAAKRAQAITLLANNEDVSDFDCHYLIPVSGCA
jgi:hypothetical protein